MKLSEDKRIGFDDKSHTYIDTETGEFLTSVTTKLSQFKQPFNAVEVAERCAVKRGVTAAELLQEWDNKRDLACESGTYIHQGLEDYLRGLEYELDFSKYAKARIAEDFINKVLKPGKIEPILIEPILYDIDKGIAGQMDLFGKTDKGNFVFDYKTNAELKKSNYFSKLNAPFHHLDDCNFNSYQLQLNLYRELLEQTGVEVDGMFIIYFGFFDYSFIKIKKMDVIKHL